MSTFLSPHISIEVACASETASRRGIQNTPTPEIRKSLTHTAACFELVYSLLGVEPHINSFFRCAELNTAVGGSAHSQHMLGEAVDFIAPEFGTPVEIVRKIADNRDTINFDQLILEHSWVHISFQSSPGIRPRKQILSLLLNGKYAPGITDLYGDVIPVMHKS